MSIIFVMHPIQIELLKLSKEHDVASMKLSELQRLTGAKYLQQVKHHRAMLISKGKLQPSTSSKEILSESNLIGEKSDLVRIPVLGSANAGHATLYAEARVSGYLRVSSSKLPIRLSEKLYALKVVGDSMNIAKIGPEKLSADNGDYIIADGDTYIPISNDYVVSLIDGMANIKKLIVDKLHSQVALVSESTNEYPPIVIDIDDSMDYLAQSKVLHVIKSPKQ